jgi:hypothetical protein
MQIITSAVAELENILNETFDYNKEDDPWVNELIQMFTRKGLAAIDPFESKFGEKHFKKLQKIINNNNVLISFSKSISSIQNEDVISHKCPSLESIEQELVNTFENSGFKVKKNSTFFTKILQDFKQNGFECLKLYEHHFGDFIRAESASKITQKRFFHQKLNLGSYGGRVSWTLLDEKTFFAPFLMLISKNIFLVHSETI